MTAASILRRRLCAVAGLALDASVAGFSKLVLPHRGMRCRGASSTAASVLRRRLSVVAVLARRVSIAGFSNEPALLPPSAVWGCNCDRSPFLWLRLCPIAVLSMAGNEVCARYRGATRRPLRDVPCGARYRRRRRGWASFHFLTSAASMGESLCCMMACPHIPMCGLRALGPHVMERDPRLLFRCSGAFAGSLRRMGRVVLYA